MRLICPECGACGSFSTFARDEVARRAWKAAMGIPAPAAAEVLDYVSLFRCGGGRGMAWKTVLARVEEVAALVAAGYVSDPKRRGPDRACPPKIWAEAMRVMAERKAAGGLKLPVANHNYLRTVAWDAADRIDRSVEFARNRAERSGNAAEKPPEEVEKVDRDELRKIRASRFPRHARRVDEAAGDDVAEGSSPGPGGAGKSTPDSEEMIRATVKEFREAGLEMDKIAAAIPERYRLVFERLYGFVEQ